MSAFGLVLIAMTAIFGIGQLCEQKLKRSVPAWSIWLCGGLVLASEWLAKIVRYSPAVHSLILLGVVLLFGVSVATTSRSRPKGPHH